MKKYYIIISVLLVLSTILFILLLKTEDARKYERESYQDRLLRYEADDFCLRMALAYCNRDDLHMQFIKDNSRNNSTSEELITTLADADIALTGFNLTNYISQPKEEPIAAYAIDYLLVSSSLDESSPENSTRTMRMIVQVIRNSANNRWCFEVLDYKME